MTQSVSLDTATTLEALKHETEAVRTQRNNVLAARGLVEMLVLRAVEARHRLAKGQYQVALKTPIPGKDELATSAADELGQVLRALDVATKGLSQALDQFDSLTVVEQATAPALSLIIEEAENHVRRLADLKRLTDEWWKALRPK